MFIFIVVIVFKPYNHFFNKIILSEVLKTYYGNVREQKKKWYIKVSSCLISFLNNRDITQGVR